MSNKPEKLNEIDLQKILESKFGRIPHWLTLLLERLFHVSFINNTLRRNKIGTEFCVDALQFNGFNVTFEGEMPANNGKRYTFASNHPLGAIDGLALIAHIGTTYNDKVMLLGNDFLMNINGLAPKIVPVNKIGGQNRSLKLAIDEAFASDNHILVFPAGKVSRKHNGIIEDCAWHKSFIKSSIESHRDIVPVHFYGQNSPLFYLVGRIEQLLNLRFPIGMLLLPRECYKAKGRSFRVVIGQPIAWQTFDNSLTLDQWSQWLKRKVYSL